MSGANNTSLRCPLDLFPHMEVILSVCYMLSIVYTIVYSTFYTFYIYFFILYTFIDTFTPAESEIQISCLPDARKKNILKNKTTTHTQREREREREREKKCQAAFMYRLLRLVISKKMNLPTSPFLHPMH